MIKKLTAQAILATWRIKQRFDSKPHTIDVIQELISAKRILVSMPATLDCFQVALESLRTLKSDVPSWHITLIVRKNSADLPGDLFGAEIVQYSQDDLNFWGLPREKFITDFKSNSYDLALDLTFDFDFLSFYLFKLSNAPMIVCFGSPHKSSLCNVEIRVNPIESIESKYQAMVKYLSALLKSENSSNRTEPLNVTA